MNERDEWSQAGEFLNSIFDEVSKGFQKAAEEIEKQYPNGFDFDFLNPERRPYGARPEQEGPCGPKPEDGPCGPKPERDPMEAPKPEGPEMRRVHPRRPVGPRPPFAPGFGGPRGRRPMHGPDGKGFPADVIDYGDALEIAAVLPGFDKNKISVTMKGDELVIKAVKDWREVPNQEKYVAIEQPYGSFERHFPVGNVDGSSIRAAYKDGILHVSMQKVPEPTGTTITIE